MKRRMRIGGGLMGPLSAAVALASCRPELSAMLPEATRMSLRPDHPDAAQGPRYLVTDAVEIFDLASIRVHFTRDGDNAVPDADTDGSGVPDFVEDAAAVYEEALAFYQTSGFSAPRSDVSAADNGGDERFDVYLLDLQGQADGVFRVDPDGCEAPARCSGAIVQDNDFAGLGYPSVAVAQRTVASHELFHAVQASYHAGLPTVLVEGSAVWASELFDESLTDLEAFAGYYLSQPQLGLTHPAVGASEPFAYGAALFFRFLQERHEPQLVAKLWEACSSTDAHWLTVLDEVLQLEHDTNLGDALVDFAAWNLFTGLYADPSRGYEAGHAYPHLSMGYPPLPVGLPLHLAPAASRAYLVDSTDHDPLWVGLTGDAEDVRVLVAGRKGTAWGEVAELGAAGEVDLDGAPLAAVVVINTRPTLPARQPALCLGDAQQVEQCLIDPTQVGSGGTGGAGGHGSPAPTPSGCQGAPAPSIAIMLAFLRRRRPR